MNGGPPSLASELLGESLALDPSFGVEPSLGVDPSGEVEPSDFFDASLDEAESDPESKS
jgi:hypothetical protein